MRIFCTKTMRELKTKFKIGEFVFLKSDPDQLQRQIIAYYISHDLFQYILSCGTEQTNHFEFEINTEKNILLSLN